MIDALQVVPDTRPDCPWEAHLCRSAAGAGPCRRPDGRHTLCPQGPPFSLVETDAWQLPASAREREAPPLHRIKTSRTLRTPALAVFGDGRASAPVVTRGDCCSGCERAPTARSGRARLRSLELGVLVQIGAIGVSIRGTRVRRPALPVTRPTLPKSGRQFLWTRQKAGRLSG